MMARRASSTVSAKGVSQCREDRGGGHTSDTLGQRTTSGHLGLHESLVSSLSVGGTLLGLLDVGLLDDLGLALLLEHGSSRGGLLGLSLGSDDSLLDSLVGGSGSSRSGSSTDSWMGADSEPHETILNGGSRWAGGRLLSNWLNGGHLLRRRSGGGTSADGEVSEGEHDD